MFHGMALRALLEPTSFCTDRQQRSSMQELLTGETMQQLGLMSAESGRAALQPSEVVLAGTRALDEPERRFMQDSGMVQLPVGCLDHRGRGSDRQRCVLLDALQRTGCAHLCRRARY
jgi:hypothetical protein